MRIINFDELGIQSNSFFFILLFAFWGYTSQLRGAGESSPSRHNDVAVKIECFY